MLKRILLGLVLVLVFTAISPGSPMCAWCPTYTCYKSDSCSSECKCMSKDYHGGQCVDRKQSLSLESAGWHELK